MSNRENQSRKQRFRLTRAKHGALQLLGEFFVLRTNDLATLQKNRTATESDCRTARHTLYLLFQEGQVHRIPYLDLEQIKGGATYAYGLSDRGAKEYGGKTFDDYSRRTLDHELAITDFHIAIRRFCAEHGRELSWQQSGLKTKTIHPDAYFSVTDPAKEGRNTNHFFLEIERSKIGNVKDGQPSIMRKLGSYYTYYNSLTCGTEWGISTFRVIVQVANDTRAANLLNALNKNYRHRMFWITGPGTDLRFRTPRDFNERTYSPLDI